MSDNINDRLNVNEKPVEAAVDESRKALAEAKTAKRLTPEYILEQIEKLLSDRDHITQALTALQDANSPVSECEAENIAIQAKFSAIAEVVKSRETTIQQALSFYRKLYDEVNSPLDIALAQAEKMLSTPVFSDYTVDLFDSLWEPITMSCVRAANRTEESDLEFKRRAVMAQMENFKMSPDQIAELLKILDE